MTEMNNDCSLRLFADDALIYATEYSRQQFNGRLNEQIVRVDEWLSRNRLYLNVRKTSVILIRWIRKKVAEGDLKVKFRGENLELVHKIKYLRVIILDIQKSCGLKISYNRNKFKFYISARPFAVLKH